MKMNRKLKKISAEIYKPYYNMFFISICIAVLGILMITSATYTESGLFYVSRQVIFVLIGIMFMIVGAHIDIAKGLYKLWVNHFSYGFSPKCFRLSPSCRHP